MSRTLAMVVRLVVPASKAEADRVPATTPLPKKRHREREHFSPDTGRDRIGTQTAARNVTVAGPMVAAPVLAVSTLFPLLQVRVPLKMPCCVLTTSPVIVPLLKIRVVVPDKGGASRGIRLRGRASEQAGAKAS